MKNRDPRYHDLECDKIYVIDAKSKDVVDGPFERYSDVPLRKMGFDGKHFVKTGEELRELSWEQQATKA